jgi:hypothetical protein
MAESDKTRIYSPEEADRLIPTLEAAFEVIARTREVLRVHVSDLEAHGVDLSKPITAAMLAGPGIEDKVNLALGQHKIIRAELDKLAVLGVEVKALDGLCDVRSRYEGRIVYLCWRRGEPGFLFWHDLDTGFKGRQRIMRTSDFSGTLLN